MIYLHAGLGKCGSSTIQHFASEQVAALSDAGLIYPSVGRRGLIDHISVGVAARQSQFRQAEPLAPSMAALQAAMLDERAPSFLLSSENFLQHRTQQSARNAKALRRFLGQAPVCILIYIREYPAWIESVYAQKTKRGENSADMDALIHQRRPTPIVSMVHGLMPWIDTFGAANIRLRSLQRSNLVGGDLILDLLDAVGVHAPMPAFARVNESPPWAFLELARDIASRMPNPSVETQGLLRIWLRRFAMDASAALHAAGLKPGRIQYLSQQDWRGCRDLYYHDVGLINAILPDHAVPLLNTPDVPEREAAPSLEQVPQDVLDVYLEVLGTRRFLRTVPEALLAAKFPKAMPEALLAAVRPLLKRQRRKARRQAAAATEDAA